jgi:hypothetical protein
VLCQKRSAFSYAVFNSGEKEEECLSIYHPLFHHYPQGQPSDGGQQGKSCVTLFHLSHDLPCERAWSEEMLTKWQLFGLVNGKAREELASLRDALDSVSSHSRRKSAEHAFAGGSSNYPPSPMGAPTTPSQVSIRLYQILWKSDVLL